jgi:hypothetical protein
MRHHGAPVLLLQWVIEGFHDSICCMSSRAMVSFAHPEILRQQGECRQHQGENDDIPSSNIKRARFINFTNPCVNASARTACVDTTIWMLSNTASQIRGSLHLSTPSDPISNLVPMAGRYELIKLCCCLHRSTVGARNQMR